MRAGRSKALPPAPKGLNTMPTTYLELLHAMNLSLENLVKGKTHAGMLLWVDSPHVSNAHVLLDKWGFTFHSVLHVTSYTNPLPVLGTSVRMLHPCPVLAPWLEAIQASTHAAASCGPPSLCACAVPKAKVGYVVSGPWGG